MNTSMCKTYLPTTQEYHKAFTTLALCLWAFGTAITVTLFVLYVKQFVFLFHTAHKSFRRHLYYFTSIYLVMSLMTTIGMGIPRAHSICSALKDVHMAIGIGHFVDLTIVMYGSENKMAKALEGSYINFRSIIFLKFCVCINPIPVTRERLRVLKWLVWQMKWSQTIYYSFKLILVKALEDHNGQLPPNASTAPQWLHFLNIASFMSGVLSLILIWDLVWAQLTTFSYSIKSKVVRLTIMATKLQRLLFELLEACGVFPCFPPFVSSQFSMNVCKDFVYMIEVLILGCISYKIYSKEGVFEESSLDLEFGVEVQPLTEHDKSKNTSGTEVNRMQLPSNDRNDKNISNKQKHENHGKKYKSSKYKGEYKSKNIGQHQEGKNKMEPCEEWIAPKRKLAGISSNEVIRDSQNSCSNKTEFQNITPERPKRRIVTPSSDKITHSSKETISTKATAYVSESRNIHTDIEPDQILDDSQIHAIEVNVHERTNRQPVEMSKRIPSEILSSKVTPELHEVIGTNVPSAAPGRPSAPKPRVQQTHDDFADQKLHSTFYVQNKDV